MPTECRHDIPRSQGWAPVEVALLFAGLPYIGLPEQAVGGFPLGLGLVVKDRPTELSCFYSTNFIYYTRL